MASKIEDTGNISAWFEKQARSREPDDSVAEVFDDDEIEAQERAALGDKAEKIGKLKRLSNDELAWLAKYDPDAVIEYLKIEDTEKKKNKNYTDTYNYELGGHESDPLKQGEEQQLFRLMDKAKGAGGIIDVGVEDKEALEEAKGKEEAHKKEVFHNIDIAKNNLRNKDVQTTDDDAGYNTIFDAVLDLGLFANKKREVPRSKKNLITEEEDAAYMGDDLEDNEKSMLLESLSAANRKALPIDKAEHLLRGITKLLDEEQLEQLLQHMTGVGPNGYPRISDERLKTIVGTLRSSYNTVSDALMKDVHFPKHLINATMRTL